MKPSKACNCHVCRLTRTVTRLAKKGTAAERKAVEQLLLEWEAASTDAARWEMKFKGTWPNG